MHLNESMRGLIAAAALLLLAAAPARPVHVLTTGGTIGSTTAGGSFAAETLLSGVAGIAVTSEAVADLGSSRLGLADLDRLRACIEAVFAARPELAGIVVTHGTDTLEETAYYLRLTLDDPRPVVLTGSMRPSDAVSADGPANLAAAVRVAADPRARGYGVLVVLNDTVLAAASAAKRHTTRLDAFQAANGGPVGMINGDRVDFLAPPPPGPGVRFSGGLARAPRIEIAYAAIGARGDAIDALVAGGAQGLVVATFGSGRVTPSMEAAIARALRRGVPVVVAARVGGGGTPPIYDDPTKSAQGRLAVIPAGLLSAQKARLLLMLALGQTRDPSTLRRLFEAAGTAEADTP